MIIGGIDVGRYGKLTRDALARSFSFNGGIMEVTRNVDNI